MSLGIDMVSYKTCSFDCIYCQIGKTARKTIKRKDFGRTGRIMEELAAKLEYGMRPDHITLGGSGEPTLNLEIGSVIRNIKKITDIPVAVLTNASLLYDPVVRKDLDAADVVLPSLDAADEEMFRRINRPHPDISLNRLVDGLAAFSQFFAGELWLEIFFIEEFNTSDEQIEQFNALLKIIDPEKVHLNTAVRPPAEHFAAPVKIATLEAIASKLGENAEIVAEFDEKKHVFTEGELVEDDLIGMLERRPCTVSDIAAGLNISEKHAFGCVKKLLAEGKVAQKTTGMHTYYFPVRNIPSL